MSAMLLLKENADLSETKNRRRPRLVEPEAKTGCTCDRWGHPCANCAEREPANTSGPVEPTAQVAKVLD